MTRQAILRAAWLACAIAGSTLPAPDQQPQPATAPAPYKAASAALKDRIAAILASPAVARDHWGIQVTTLDGTALYSLNEGQLFQPVSNAKLFTTAAALALLGPNQRFTTRLQYDADGDTDTIEGDLILIGDGDASLNGAKPPNQTSSQSKDAAKPENVLAQFADSIATAGIKHIKGNIVGDDTVFPWEPYPQDWAIDDMVWGYAAPVSGLSIDDNQLQLTITPGRSEKHSPTIRWQQGTPPYYTLDATALQTAAQGSGSHVQIERETGSKTLRLYGSIAIDAPPNVEAIAIADPAEYAALALKSLLEARGVQVDGTAKARHRTPTQPAAFLTESTRPVPTLPAAISPEASSFLTGILDCYNVCPKSFQHTSPPVEDDVIATNKMSLNLHAELLLRHLGRQYGECGQPPPTAAKSCAAEGARVVRQFLINAGIDSKDFIFFDGSGLSGHDLVTPRATAKLLALAARDPSHGSRTGEPQPWFATWKASLPVGGVDGTLASRFTQPPLKGHVFAKTGTHSEARALSGYLDAASGRTIIFSIFNGNHLPSTSDDREAIDQIVAAIQSAE